MLLGGASLENCGPGRRARFWVHDFGDWRVIILPPTMNLTATLTDLVRLMLRPRLMAGAVMFLTCSRLSAEYYTFAGENGGKIDGADIIYQETRYPYWAQSTYNARWFPGIAGNKTSTSLYSGPVYGGDGDKGTREVGYIWSFWGVDHPVRAGDSDVPVWWHANMHDVPSIGEGASGKVEGKWTMSTGVWYPGVLRIWRPTGEPEDVSMAGQWIKDGVSGKWHHMATFRMPFVATRFTGDCGFIEDPSNGNRKPRRVEFRNYYFHRNGQWIPAREFKPSTRQATEKGSSGLIENNAAGFFETCSGPAYQGNMGPGAQEKVYTMAMPESPVFDPVVVRKVVAAVTQRQVAVRWELDDKSAPQFSYKIELYNSADGSGNPLKTCEMIDPDTSEVLVATDAAARGVRVTITDVFGQVSKAAVAVPLTAEPMPAKPAAGTVGGLNYAYYEGTWKSLPAFDAAMAADLAVSGAVNGLDLSVRRKNEGFAGDFRGYLDIPAPGIWLFSLRSSDGSRLILDGDTVIDSDGIHGAGYEVAGARALAAGKHEVEVICFKAKDGSGQECKLALTWEGPGHAKEPVPESAWSRVPAAGEPLVKLMSPHPGGSTSADKAGLLAAVKAENQTLQMVRFYQDATVCGTGYAAELSDNATTFGTRELLGCGQHSLRARLIYGVKSEHTLDSPSVACAITQPAIAPWEFSAIGQHRFPAASAVDNGTHTLLGDGLNINWQRIKGDTSIVARIKRRPANSWVSQFDGNHIDGGWSGGVIFRQDIDAHPGSEIGNRFVALFASANNSIHVQDHTNHNAGGLFWGPNVQNPQGTYQWLKLQREGQQFHAFLSVDGTDWKLVETRDLSKEKLDDMLYVGVFTLARPSTNTNPNRWQFADVGIGNNPRVSRPQGVFSAYWPMDEGTGSGTRDRGGESLDGMLLNGVTWVDGVRGKAVELNGKDQAVMMPPLGLRSNTITLSGWVKRRGDQVDWAGIAMCRGTAATGLMMGPGNQLRFTWDPGKNASYNFGSGLVLPDGKWAFIALVVEPAKATLYLKDGIRLRSAVCDGVFDVAPFDTDFYLGYDPNSDTRRFKGTLDEFRVCRKAMSPAEITALAEMK